MATITNTGKTPRAFFVSSKGDYVEIAQGEAAEVTVDDLAALAKSPAFVACINPEALAVAGADFPPVDAAPAPTKGKKAAAPVDGSAA